MQVLMAFTTDPAFRPDALDRMKLRLPESYAALKASPGGVMRTKVPQIVHGDDPRYGTPSEQDMMAVHSDDIATLIKKTILTTAPIEITIVGDVIVDEAIAQVAATFGTLPRRVDALTQLPGSDIMRFPTTELNRTFVHEGRKDQNISAIYWPTTGFYGDTRRATGLRLLAAAITLRELDEIREKQGASYGVNADSTSSTIYKDFGYIATMAQVKPEVDATFYDTIVRMVATCAPSR